MSLYQKKLTDKLRLERNITTGIAHVVNDSAGQSYTCHPNISSSGSVSGMIKQGYWRKEDRIIESDDYYYNCDEIVLDNNKNKLAQKHCLCKPCLEYKLAEQIALRSLDSNRKDVLLKHLNEYNPNRRK